MHRVPEQCCFTNFELWRQSELCTVTLVPSKEFGDDLRDTLHLSNTFPTDFLLPRN